MCDGLEKVGLPQSDQGRPRINFLTVRRYPTKFPLAQSMSSTGATADGFRPPVRDRSCRRRAVPIDWQRRGVVPIHRSRPRLHREISSGPRVATAVRRAIAPADDGRIPYERLIPGIGRQLALMRPVDRKVASPDATKRKLVALKKHAKILCEDMSASASETAHLNRRNCAGKSKAPVTGWQGRTSKKSGNASCADCGGTLLWPDGHEADPHHADGRRQSPWSISRVPRNNIQDFRHQGFG
jgi:hypothetical protein